MSIVQQPYHAITETFLIKIYKSSRIRYEENYFTRLPVSRQDRHKSRQQNSAKSLADELIGLSGRDSGKKRKISSRGGKKRGIHRFVHTIN